MTATKWDELIKRLRLLEIDHEPEGWPAIQMRDVSALLDALAAKDAAPRITFKWDDNVLRKTQ